MTGTPAAGPRHRPHSIVYPIAVLGALTVIIALTLPTGIAWLATRVLPLPWPPLAQSDPTTDGASAGDPYFPSYGSSGYDAQSYRIMIDWDPSQARLTGHTVITAVATRDLTTVDVDLALDVTAVSVNGVPATASRAGFADTTISGPIMIARGATFTVDVHYGGQPGLLRGPARPYRAVGEEVIIAGEPESSAWWFPADDHPSDPATMDLSVRVPAGMEAISIGRLVSRDSGGKTDFDTWHWVMDQPVATYLIFLGLGQYAVQQGNADGRPYVYAVSERLTATQRRTAFAALQRTPGIVADLAARFGPYPFGVLGGFVPSMELPFDGLEAQTRPVYAADSITDDRFGTELLVHELAHMWFGDHVTVARWDDIFTNEAYASWAAWAYAEDHGGRTAAEQLQRSYRGWQDRPGFWAITMIDPGPDHLFDAVYYRGPMTLQALRTVIGDAAFERLNREWAQQAGSRSLEQWMVKAQSITTIDLSPFFAAWIYGTTAPPRTAAYGLA